MTNLKVYNSSATGDLDDWAPATNDAFNAFDATGVQNDISAVDVVVMDVIGYDPVPEPATMLLISTGALGLFGYIRRQRMK